VYLTTLRPELVVQLVHPHPAFKLTYSLLRQHSLPVTRPLQALKSRDISVHSCPRGFFLCAFVSKIVFPLQAPYVYTRHHFSVVAIPMRIFLCFYRKESTFPGSRTTRNEELTPWNLDCSPDPGNERQTLLFYGFHNGDWPTPRLHLQLIVIRVESHQDFKLNATHDHGAARLHRDTVGPSAL
jgi:hypothetical protein